MAKTMDTKELLRERRTELQEQIDAIRKKSQPLRDKIDAENKKVEAARAKYRELRDEVLPQIHEIEKDIAALSQELANVAMALGGRRMSEAP